MGQTGSPPMLTCDSLPTQLPASLLQPSLVCQMRLALCLDKLLGIVFAVGFSRDQSVKVWLSCSQGHP